MAKDHDPTLVRLLGEAGLPADLPALDALLAGIEAAPAGQDPDAWLELIGPDLPPALTSCPARAPRAACAGRTAASLTTPTGLRRLRDALRERGVDGFVLMRTDEHGSEYLPGYAERVAWLTGFTGSAAQAAVTMDARHRAQRRPLHGPDRAGGRRGPVRAPASRSTSP